MKCAVWPNTALRQIPLNTTELHLVRPLSLKKLSEITAKRKIKAVSYSESTAKRLKAKTKEFLANHSILLSVSNQAGRPLSATLEKMLSVVEMVRDHRSFREIQDTTGIAKSTCHYWIRHAKRQKIRDNGKTLFLR
ncbi:MAG: hypothetical protein V1777_03245 [Candidatus Micrarchaeota archaeon]